MTDADRPEAAASSQAARPQWPGVIGAVGIVLGVLLVLDKLGDLQTLNWTEEDWRRIFAPDVAASIARASQPAAWSWFAAMVQMALGGFLVGASVLLRRRRRTGVALCHTWAWSAIAWAVVDVGWAGWQLARFGDSLPGMWLAPVGIAMALAMLLAFPVFLLVWLGRPDVRLEVDRWPA